jgi:hypothetical protein
MLALPENPAARGPWSVGARQAKIGYLNAEIWYPAAVGSEQGKSKLVYDLREYLPTPQQGGVAASDTIFQPCDCLDAAERHIWVARMQATQWT